MELCEEQVRMVQKRPVVNKEDIIWLPRHKKLISLMKEFL